MKVNLTKKNEADLEEAIELLGKLSNENTFDRKRNARRLAVDLQNILIKHDNRKEKEY